ncbi:MAG: maleylpyruvate isomerase family mycothiol-dependent enzyme [Actinomycetota bacterium]
MEAITRAFDHDTYCDLVEAAGERFIAAATLANPTAIVPSCPEWTVDELVEHMGVIHRWAGAHVQRMSQVRLGSADFDPDRPKGPADYEAWLRAGIQELVATLRAGDPDAEVWGWGADKHVRFWPRRMLHETTIHRSDLEITNGTEPEIDPTIATDGIDELLENLPHARRFRPEMMSLRGGGEALVFAAEDVGVAWTIRLGSGGFEWSRARAGDASVTVQGLVAPLLLYIYGRETAASRAVSVDGDTELLTFWRTNSAL